MRSRKFRGILAVTLGCIGYGTAAFATMAVSSPQIAMVTPQASMHHVLKNTATGRAKVFQVKPSVSR